MNMKSCKLLFTCLLITLFATNLWADQKCDKMYKNATNSYNNGDYATALKVFRIMEKQCSDQYNVSGWIKKCNDNIRKAEDAKRQATNPTPANSQQQTATQPKTPKNKRGATISVEDTLIVADYQDTTINISVKSNNDWEIQYANGYWYNASKQDNQLSVHIDKNPYDTEREDLFEIRSVSDTTKVVTLTVRQKGAEKFLTLAAGQLEDNGQGGDQTISISTSLQAWRIEYSPDWVQCHKANENKAVFIHVNENMTTQSRSDSIVIVAGDLRQTIAVLQKTQAPDKEQIEKMKAKINSISINDNVFRNGSLGILIHIDMHLDNMNGFKTKCVAKFTDGKDKPLGNKEQAQYLYPAKDSYDANDYTIHIPYSNLNHEGLMKCKVEIQEAFSQKMLTQSVWKSFVYGIAVDSTDYQLSEEGGTKAIVVKSNYEWLVDSVVSEYELLEVNIKGDTLFATVKPHTYDKKITSAVIISDKSRKFTKKITFTQSAYDALAKINTGIDIIHTSMSEVEVPLKGSVEMLVNCDQKWRISNRFDQFLSAKQKKNTIIFKRGGETRSVDLNLHIDILTDDGKRLRIPVVVKGTGK